MYIYIYMYIHVCTCIHIHKYTHKCVCACVCVRVHVYMTRVFQSRETEMNDALRSKHRDTDAFGTEVCTYKKWRAMQR